jgi:hypothetical protein
MQWLPLKLSQGLPALVSNFKFKRTIAKVGNLVQKFQQL